MALVSRLAHRPGRPAGGSLALAVGQNGRQVKPSAGRQTPAPFARGGGFFEEQAAIFPFNPAKSPFLPRHETVLELSSYLRVTGAPSWLCKWRFDMKRLMLAAV